MGAWKQLLQFLVTQPAKRSESIHNSSFCTFNYSKASLFPGEVPCLSSVQKSFLSSIAKPLRQLVQHLEFISSRRIFSDSSSIYFSSVAILPSNVGSNETQEGACRNQPILKGVKQDAARGLFSRKLHNTFVHENDIVFGEIRSFCSQSQTLDKSRCWNCAAEAGKVTPFLFCEACCSIQPINGCIDYFQLFELGRTYKIEVEELEAKYKNWQKKLHPDLVHSKSETERKFAAEQSGRVIDAYRTLADPLLRAIYLVKLEGLVVDEEERITDPKLLAEIMELREDVEEAEGPQALKDIQTHLWKKLQQCSDTFEDAFVNKKYEDAVASIQRMTYYRRANEEIIKKL